MQSVLASVQDCMVRTPPPWPQEWREEYTDTIREAITSDPNAPQYGRRLDILREGFALYWPDLKNTEDRSYFEVRRAQIRWYVENLMAADLPNEQKRQTLRRQYEDLANHAAEGLIAQFSFLDPNRVQKAKTDYLAECYRSIDAPLLPIFLTVFSQSQVDQIKERWRDLRYARVDLWRQLGGPNKSSKGSSTASIQTHPDYLLAQRSLDQWQSHIWALTAAAPEYYQTAVNNELKTRKRRLEALRRARDEESRIDNATLQTEYLSFLLAALLETAQEEASTPSKGQDLTEPER